MAEDDWWAECHALCIAFANGVDRHRDEAVLALFTEDATIDRLGAPITGHAAIRQWLAGRPQDVVTRHVCTNFEARRVAPDRVDGLILFTFYRAAKTAGAGVLPLTGPDMIGEYVDEFQLTADGWRIGKRTIHATLQKPA